jgi:2-hydroxychromene-2-carboxylate isomerase
MGVVVENAFCLSGRESQFNKRFAKRILATTRMKVKRRQQLAHAFLKVFFIHEVHEEHEV